uniref:Uncharacterized protein n=1 Tax=Arundo donax TaxID=35708 RepID=A0A0A8Z4N3_ARUDO
MTVNWIQSKHQDLANLSQKPSEIIKSEENDKHTQK